MYVTFHGMFAVEKYKASISSMSKVLMKEVKLIRSGSVRKGGKTNEMYIDATGGSFDSIET